MKSIVVSFIYSYINRMDGDIRIHPNSCLLNLKETGQLKDLEVGIYLSTDTSRNLWSRVFKNKEMA
jgi:hypothetical protein